MKRLLILFFFISFSCSDKKDNSPNDFKTLFMADCLRDLNKLTKRECKFYFDDYWLDDDKRHPDSLATKKFNFALRVYIEKEIIDSLHRDVSSILMQNKEQFRMDTAVYISYPNFVQKDLYKNKNVLNDLKKYISSMTIIQDSLRLIQKDIEKTRVGPKKEKIICQLSRQTVFFNDIAKCNSNAELFLETEKQFNILYRELNCTLYSIKLVNQWKSASNHHKTRI